MSGVVSRYKDFYANPKHLNELDEARGKLISIAEVEGQTVAAFKWGSIALPDEMFKELGGFVGEVVAVLRLDGRYHARRVEDA